MKRHASLLLALGFLLLANFSQAQDRGSSTTEIQGQVFRAGESDHSGTAVVLTAITGSVPAISYGIATLAVVVGGLLLLLSRRRRWAAALTLGGIAIGLTTAVLAALQTTSDSTGLYELSPDGGGAFPNGSYQVDFSFDGFIPQTVNFQIDDQSPALLVLADVTLQRASTTPTATATAVLTPTQTFTQLVVPSSTPTSPPDATSTATPEATSTSTAPAEATATPTASTTPVDTATSTSTATQTPTSTNAPSNTPTSTSVPSNTPTHTFTPAHTFTATFTPTAPPTPIDTATSTSTATATSTPTSTRTPTSTGTPTNTLTPTPPTCTLNGDCGTGMCYEGLCVSSVNGCTISTAVDMTGMASTNVTFPNGNFTYSPKCLKVSIGTQITFSGGNFAVHPLVGGTFSGGAETPATSGPFIPATTSGTTKTFTMTQSATFPYYCDAHSAIQMTGAIFVVP